MPKTINSILLSGHSSSAVKQKIKNNKAIKKKKKNTRGKFCCPPERKKGNPTSFCPYSVSLPHRVEIKMMPELAAEKRSAKKRASNDALLDSHQREKALSSRCGKWGGAGGGGVESRPHPTPRLYIYACAEKQRRRVADVPLILHARCGICARRRRGRV